MFGGLVLRWQAKLDAVVTSGLWIVVAAFALLVSFAFLGAAVFILAQETYGAIRTCLGFRRGLSCACAARRDRPSGVSAERAAA